MRNCSRKVSQFSYSMLDKLSNEISYIEICELKLIWVTKPDFSI